MKIFLSLVTTIVLFSGAAKASQIINCFPNSNPRDVGTFKMGNSGKLEYFKYNVEEESGQLAKAKKNSIFIGFVDTVGNEGVKIFVARNGFSIAEIITTADRLSIGINLKTGKGFYKYQDFGSGNGNYKEVLTCNLAE